MKGKYFFSVLFNSENHHTSPVTLIPPFHIFLISQKRRRNKVGGGGKGSNSLRRTLCSQTRCRGEGQASKISEPILCPVPLCRAAWHCAREGTRGHQALTQPALGRPGLLSTHVRPQRGFPQDLDNI